MLVFMHNISILDGVTVVKDGGRLSGAVNEQSDRLAEAPTGRAEHLSW